MKSWKSIWAVAVLSLGIPLYFVYSTRSLLWCFILMLWVLAVLFTNFYWTRRTSENEQQAVIRSLEETAVRTLNHHRHDWMNDLQILYGYVQLGKIDKAVQCVDRIKERMALESKIAKLGVPSLIFYLQSFRTLNSNLELVVDVQDHVQLADRITPEQEADLSMTIMQSIRAYQYCGVPVWRISKINLKLHQEGKDLIVRFEGEGSHGDPELLRQQIYNVVQGKRMKAEQLHPSQASFQLRVPCEL